MVLIDGIPARNRKGHLNAVVEAPRGSKTKYSYDPELKLFVGGHALPLGMEYPWDWGFIAGTRAADGDPLDALILWDNSSYPGIVISCRPLAVLRVRQRDSKSSKTVRNDRLVVLPVDDPCCDWLRKPSHIPQRVREEIERFFLNAVFFSRKELKLEGWKNAEAADRLVDSLTL
jgi:inorganic pyrophosphatase